MIMLICTLFTIIFFSRPVYWLGKYLYLEYNHDDIAAVYYTKLAQWWYQYWLMFKWTREDF